MARALHVVVLVLLVGSWSRSQETKKEKVPEQVEKAIEVVQNHLKRLGGQGAQVYWKDQAEVIRLFPNHSFIVARFRQFPVARVLPEGLGASNLFAVPKEGKFQHLKDAKGLEVFFKGYLGEVKEERALKDTARAWLHLAQEFHQDGMYKFSLFDEATQVAKEGEGKKASGKVVVMAGGNGEITASLTFDSSGRLRQVAESAKVRPGPRPICQATRLLDADPLVRRIAEQDLLIMGLPAKDYLDEQRAKAGPELRQAIDKLWQKIQSSGW